MSRKLPGKLAEWIDAMKKQVKKPKPDTIYVVWDNLYEWVYNKETENYHWYRLTALEAIQLYMDETNGEVSPKSWITSKANAPQKRKGKCQDE